MPLSVALVRQEMKNLRCKDKNLFGVQIKGNSCCIYIHYHINVLARYIIFNNYIILMLITDLENLSSTACNCSSLRDKSCALVVEVLVPALSTEIFMWSNLL